MEVLTTANGIHQSQEPTKEIEQITFISEEDARKKSSRLFIHGQTYVTFIRAFSRLREGHGEWCHVKTNDYKHTRKIVLRVAKKVAVALVIQKTVEGLQFRIATDEEVESRKKTGTRLVEARKKG